MFSLWVGYILQAAIANVIEQIVQMNDMCYWHLASASYLCFSRLLFTAMLIFLFNSLSNCYLCTIKQKSQNENLHSLIVGIKKPLCVYKVYVRTCQAECMHHEVWV